jgi:hypothetical protein
LQGTVALAKLLTRHPKLETLLLTGAKRNFEESSLISVLLSGNSIGEDGAQAIAGMLVRNTTLRVLDVSCTWTSFITSLSHSRSVQGTNLVMVAQRHCPVRSPGTRVC